MRGCGLGSKRWLTGWCWLVLAACADTTTAPGLAQPSPVPGFDAGIRAEPPRTHPDAEPSSRPPDAQPPGSDASQDAQTDAQPPMAADAEMAWPLGMNDVTILTPLPALDSTAVLARAAEAVNGADRGH